MSNTGLVLKSKPSLPPIIWTVSGKLAVKWLWPIDSAGGWSIPRPLGLRAADLNVRSNT